MSWSGVEEKGELFFILADFPDFSCSCVLLEVAKVLSVMVVKYFSEKHKVFITRTGKKEKASCRAKG